MERPALSAASAWTRTRLGGLSTGQWAWAYGVLAVAYVLLCVHQPLSMNVYAGHDDNHFVEDARSILAGDWLGTYDRLTLIKGPGFSYFLVVNNVLGLPLSLTFALVYVAACAAVCAALSRTITIGRATTFLLFTLLLFQPAEVPNHVIRDSFYHSLFLFVVAGSIHVAFDRRSRGQLVRAGLAGVALGWFWITRDEGPWIVPGLLVLFGIRLWRGRRLHDGSVRPLLLGVGVMVLVAAAPVLATSAVNKAQYDEFAVTDFSGGPFHAAVGQLDRIEAGPELQRVPVSRRALAAAYRVSPAARELQPFLDGEGGRNWGSPTCEVYPRICGELAGGWFNWALRDAAAAAGHYTSGAEANRYFTRLTDEISAACGSGALHCHTNPLPLMPVLTRDTLTALPGAMLHAARFTTYDEPPPPATASVGTSELLDQAQEFLGRPLLSRTEEQGFQPDASRWLHLKDDLTHLYRGIMPVLLVGGLLAIVVAFVLRLRGRPADPDVVLLAMVAWLLYVSRLGLIALVDVTAAPAVNAQYLEPAFLALSLAAALSFVAVGSSLRTSVSGLEAAPSTDESRVHSPSTPEVQAGSKQTGPFVAAPSGSHNMPQ